MKNNIFILLSSLFLVNSAFAKDTMSRIFYYDEAEQGSTSQTMRYIVNKNYLRIDNGQDDADFILFDVKQKVIHSINHEDRTILKIENKKWQTPKFDFSVNTQFEIMQDAPNISDKQVFSYLLKADDITCTQVSLIKDMFADDMQVFYQYQQVLSGQQVATLNNTPKELHTPCFLLDQIYHSGDYYKQGLPVQISYSRGYEKFLKDYKESKIDVKLFIKPDGYSEYTAAF
ncbi:MAG: hypothetical protein OQK46_11035 [Gammaproteobacteria bacterium]|nr:hypothetical protein [Gammaproteobacteria bacterium]